MDVSAALGARCIDLTGARGGSARRWIAEVHAATGRRIVWIAPDVASARAALADIVHLDAMVRGEEPREDVLESPELGERTLWFPPADHSPYSDVIPDRARQQARMAVLFKLALDFPWSYLVLAAPSVVSRIPALDTIAENSDLVRTGMQIARDDLVRLLVGIGYHRLPVVETPGTFAVRGEIVDVHPPGLPAPVRVEMAWDEVERIRMFDPDTQRTTETIEEFFVHPARDLTGGQEARDRAASRIRDLCDRLDIPTRRARAIVEEVTGQRTVFRLGRFLPAFHGELPSLLGQVLEAAGDPLLVLDDPGSCLSTARRRIRALEDEYGRLTASGEPAYAPGELGLGEEGLEELLRAARTVFVHPAASPPGDPTHGDEALHVDLGAEDHRDLSREVRRGEDTRARTGSLRPLARRIREWVDEGRRVILTSRTEGGTERIADLLAGYGIEVGDDGPVLVSRGPLAAGYHLTREGEVVISDREIFGVRIARRTKKRSGRKPLEDLRTLEPGDHVVHKIHGVGKFEGLVRRQHDDVVLELIRIGYRGGDTLYVPVHGMDQVQKFVGGTPSRLDKLGGETFAKVREKTSKAIAELADRLLELYARRKAYSGRALHPRDRDFREFEAQFPWEETPDQGRAIEDVMSDLERDRPMDRLVCGDVGFGKTEVALRAAYRVAMAGRQVAVLVPTTVLAQQHLSTMRQRFAGTPVRVEGLSRFQTPAARKQVVAELREGKVDVVVGTHRLLSRDVHFSDLGLLVIDEEHRFGVVQKERIKFLAPGTDVLHMTATPIPRTLQMSLGDVMDMSIIATAPVERLAVQTHVVRRSDAVLREAIMREIAREGQVFFVHNRVQTIEKVAEHLAGIVPEVRMAIGHGQMGEARLEKVMMEFVSGRVDLLVCTSIIESGLDIPNANTVIVDDAHTFGLAQLYQIRGRVGRSSEQAHAYLVVPPAGKLTKEASERIDTLVRFTHLGSGFHVATMDLEIRGAGDLLGAEQSGHVRAVGFDLYCEMLGEAVDRLRGREPDLDPEPELSFDVSAYIPEEYVEDPGLRMMLYKRMAGARAEEDVHSVVTEMRDRFGPLPDEVRALGDVMGLKVLLRRIRALGAEANRAQVRIHLHPSTPLDPARLRDMIERSGGRTSITPEMTVLHRHPGGGDTVPLARRFVESLLDIRT